MLLIIDIGNTNIKFVIYDNNNSESISRLSTSPCRTIDEYIIFFQYLIKKYNISTNSLRDIVISSVVPSINMIIFESCIIYFQLTPKIIQEHLINNLNITINFPNKIVGTDRLANVIAANSIYPNINILIIDMGSVTTFNLINDKNSYYGQTITPGMNSFSKAIESSTSLLPATKVCDVKNVLANSTLSAIESGLFWGYKSMVLGLINLIKKEQKVDYVIATGGNSRFFHEKDINEININLTTKGIMLIYKNHLKS